MLKRAPSSAVAVFGSCYFQAVGNGVSSGLNQQTFSKTSAPRRRIIKNPKAVHKCLIILPHGSKKIPKSYKNTKNSLTNFKIDKKWTIEEFTRNVAESLEIKEDLEVLIPVREPHLKKSGFDKLSLYPSARTAWDVLKKYGISRWIYFRPVG